MGVSVRRADAGDLESVWPLAREFATTFEPDREAFGRAFETILADPGSLLLVGCVDGAVCGYLLGHTHSTFLANGPVTWIEEVMVDGSRRGRGVGRSLVAAAEAWAREAGAGYVSLASRRVGGFYLALGYDESAVYYRKLLAPAGRRRTNPRIMG